MLLDLFLNEDVFGDLEHVTLQLGVTKLEVVKLSECIDLPNILLSKKSLGNAVILKGTK